MSEKIEKLEPWERVRKNGKKYFVNLKTGKITSEDKAKNTANSFFEEIGNMTSVNATKAKLQYLVAKEDFETLKSEGKIKRKPFKKFFETFLDDFVQKVVNHDEVIELKNFSDFFDKKQDFTFVVNGEKMNFLDTKLAFVTLFQSWSVKPYLAFQKFQIDEKNKIISTEINENQPEGSYYKDQFTTLVLYNNPLS